MSVSIRFPLVQSGIHGPKPVGPGPSGSVLVLAVRGSLCSVENECKNTFGSYYCECYPGYQYNEDTGSCDDLDECSPTGFICSGRADSTNFVCINTVGSYNCHCKPGLETAGLGECLDWNECFSHGFTDRSQRLIE